MGIDCDSGSVEAAGFAKMASAAGDAGALTTHETRSGDEELYLVEVFFDGGLLEAAEGLDLKLHGMWILEWTARANEPSPLMTLCFRKI